VTNTLAYYTIVYLKKVKRFYNTCPKKPTALKTFRSLTNIFVVIMNENTSGSNLINNFTNVALHDKTH
jgi:hypothetical protein